MRARILQRKSQSIIGVNLHKIALIGVQHENEIACIKAIGGKILHLETGRLNLQGELGQHISETAFERVITQERDAYVYNAKVGLEPFINEVFDVLVSWGWV